jgi:hypothetical protein
MRFNLPDTNGRIRPQAAGRPENNVPPYGFYFVSFNVDTLNLFGTALFLHFRTKGPYLQDFLNILPYLSSLSNIFLKFFGFFRINETVPKLQFLGKQP